MSTIDRYSFMHEFNGVPLNATPQSRHKTIALYMGMVESLFRLLPEEANDGDRLGTADASALYLYHPGDELVSVERDSSPWPEYAELAVVRFATLARSIVAATYTYVIERPRGASVPCLRRYDHPDERSYRAFCMLQQSNLLLQPQAFAEDANADPISHAALELVSCPDTPAALQEAPDSEARDASPDDIYSGEVDTKEVWGMCGHLVHELMYGNYEPVTFSEAQVIDLGEAA